MKSGVGDVYVVGVTSGGVCVEGVGLEVWCCLEVVLLMWMWHWVEYILWA